MFDQRPGDVANGEILKNFVDDGLKQAYGDKGYVQYGGDVEPKFIRPQSEGLDGVAELLIQIEEGRQFTVRKITFRGIEKNDETQIRELMTLKEGDLYVPSKLEASLDRINQIDRYVPLDRDRDVDIRVDEETGDLDMAIMFRKID